MKNLNQAFTLIELLTVIATIAILASLIFPTVGAIKNTSIRTRARSELKQIETAIERFNQKLGYYPQDNTDPNNPNRWALPPLYYELLGTTNVGTANAPIYVTLDGSARVDNLGLKVFGTDANGNLLIPGFANCTRPGRSGDIPNAIAFIDNLKPTQFMAITNGNFPTSICSMLGTTINGPLVYQNGNGVKLNPWRYNSSNPSHNQKSFDLWIDVTVGSKTNRICNWSDKPFVP